VRDACFVTCGFRACRLQDWRPQSIRDGLLEVVGLRSSLQVRFTATAAFRKFPVTRLAQLSGSFRSHVLLSFQEVSGHTSCSAFRKFPVTRLAQLSGCFQSHVLLSFQEVSGHTSCSAFRKFPVTRLAQLSGCFRSHVSNQDKSKARILGKEPWPAGETDEALPDCAISSVPKPSPCHL
jgi:hypothetical protein